MPVVASLCRFCSAYCPILVTVEDGRATRVVGDPDAPLYNGYTCPKGRALPEQHYGESRLLHSRCRADDGSWRDIASETAMDEIAARLQALIDRHGPRSVAVYWGTGAVSFPMTIPLAHSWLSGIGSPMFFSAGSIDKPGVQIAQALHGTWDAGHPPFDTAGAWLFVGVNPVVSKGNEGWPMYNPGQRLKEAIHERGMKVLVIDPRLSETARRADVHLQARPGEDPAILAAMIRVILKEGLHDAAFVAENAQGLDALAAAVEPFTPQYAAERAGIEAARLVEAARIFATCGYGGIVCGTGPSFATHGALTEYLALCLSTLCGNWTRAGEKLQKANVLLPARGARAQPIAPMPAWGFGEQLRVRGLGASVSGLPTSALAEEILLPGEGQVRALICFGGNPMMAWPDQQKTFAAMRALDLLVVLDMEMTATARLADYVIAPRLSLEMPLSTVHMEALKSYGHSRGIDVPYARYAPRVVEPPAGADVIEDWAFFHGLARRMGVPLELVNSYGIGSHAERPPERIALNMDAPPTAEELIEIGLRHARVPLAEVKRHPHGKLFDDIEETVLPKDPACTARLELGAPYMLADLAAVLAHKPDPATLRDFPFSLIPRRLNAFVNSHGRLSPRLGGRTPFNWAYMHPLDLAEAGLAEGDRVAIRSAHGKVETFAKPDETLRRGLVALAHGFGANPDEDDDPARAGAAVARLIGVEDDFDPITGIPRMGAIPVAVTRV